MDVDGAGLVRFGVDFDLVLHGQAPGKHFRPEARGERGLLSGG
jgi:hypothetical protein